MASLRPALFLDRDGIVNVDTDFLYKIEDVRWVEGIFELIAHARSLGYAIIIVTNQSGIGRGYYSEEQFHTLMDWMCRELASRGCVVDGVYFSPYHPVHGIGDYKQDTDCRKPKPGMLLKAAREHGLDLSRSVMVGDRCSDIAAAANAGVPMRVLLKGTGSAECPSEPGHILIHTLTEAIPLLSFAENDCKE
ncbi:MAG: HAD family hydrolase [Acidobacteria bacterium]|nr:HAD family hydrolase [Acidobacteriota bacterium]